MPPPERSAAVRQQAPDQNDKVLEVRAVHQTFEGPLPPPSILRQFDDVVPGMAERLLVMAENEAAHRHSLEVAATQANVDAQRRQLDIAEQQTRSSFRSDGMGQSFGFLISAGSVAGAIYMGSQGNTVLALALLGLPLVGIIRALRSPSTAKPAPKQ